MSDLQTAIAYHRAGRLAEAEAIYRELLAQDPAHAEALNLLGVIACQRGDYAAAIELTTRAAAIDPAHPDYQVNLGEALRRAGHLDEAIACFEKLLARHPAHAAARHNLALASNNLGYQLWTANRHDEAISAYLRAADAQPDLAAAHANAGGALRKLGRRQEALAHLEHAANADPRSSAIHRELAMALLDSGNPARAHSVCRASIALAQNPPQAADAWHTLATILLAQADIPDAAAAYEQALALKPHMEAWRFELAALRGEPITQAPDAFVKTLFDDYAPRFERHLVDDLHYRVPEELLAATLELAHASKIPPRPWDILDLGSGTGRCGMLFRPHARHIIGIDLSPNMAAASRRRGVYDHVEESHILPALARHTAAFDLILAADLFIYVGALEEVFAAAARALRPSGIIAFSIEHHEGPGFILHQRHRFAHSPTYARDTARAAGLKEILARQVTLRTDVPPGWVMATQKPQ